MGVSDTVDEIFCEYSANFDSGFTSERKCSVDATVYWSEDRELYIYPVYQSSDGKVYVASEGEKISLKESDSEEDIFIKTYRDETSEHISGEPFETTVNITFKKVNKIEKIKIYQFSEAYEELKADSYSPSGLPEKYITEKGAEHLTVEMITSEKQDGMDFESAVINKDDCEFKLYSALENGMYTETFVPVDWQ